MDDAIRTLLIVMGVLVAVAGVVVGALFGAKVLPVLPSTITIAQIAPDSGSDISALSGNMTSVYLNEPFERVTDMSTFQAMTFNNDDGDVVDFTLLSMWVTGSHFLGVVRDNVAMQNRVVLGSISTIMFAQYVGQSAVVGQNPAAFDGVFVVDGFGRDTATVEMVMMGRFQKF